MSDLGIEWACISPPSIFISLSNTKYKLILIYLILRLRMSTLDFSFQTHTLTFHEEMRKKLRKIAYFIFHWYSSLTHANGADNGCFWCWSKWKLAQLNYHFFSVLFNCLVSHTQDNTRFCVIKLVSFCSEYEMRFLLLCPAWEERKWNYWEVFNATLIARLNSQLQSNVC